MIDNKSYGLYLLRWFYLSLISTDVIIKIKI